MGNIKFSLSDVPDKKALIAAAYIDVYNKIGEISSKTSEVKGYWDTEEADAFLSKMAEVEEKLNTFTLKYEEYMKFLDTVISAYTADKESLLNKIKGFRASSGN